jgi:hypothetical protein
VEEEEDKWRRSRQQPQCERTSEAVGSKEDGAAPRI